MIEGWRVSRIDEEGVVIVDKCRRGTKLALSVESQ